ncbi:MAG: XisH family protein [Candidatus Xenobia bacterium]
MPAADVFHVTVRHALEHDGWTITDDPLVVPLGDRNLFVDLGAEQPIGAERDGRRIAVEVKSFSGPSEMRDLEVAVGQYAPYRFALQLRQPDRTLYLAVAASAWRSVFDNLEMRELRVASGLKVIVFHPDEERILEWIE